MAAHPDSPGLRTALAALLSLACASIAAGAPSAPGLPDRSARALDALPAGARLETWAAAAAAPERWARLLAAVEQERRRDPWLLFLVDDGWALPREYEPEDLESLDRSGLTVSRAGHRLRRAAREALIAMDAAARADGVTLLVSSAYRSYDYQVGVWDRGVAAEGEAATAAVIARPGHSQHQLGTAVDFGSIDDSFAGTAASRWLERHAARFGFSLSFPRGMSAETGYSWESWHYRYIGAAAAALEREFFGGAQHRLLSFLAEY